MTEKSKRVRNLLGISESTRLEDLPEHKRDILEEVEK